MHSKQVWNVDSKQTTCTMNAHSAGVNCCAISPDDKLVLSGDGNSLVLVNHIALHLHCVSDQIRSYCNKVTDNVHRILVYAACSYTKMCTTVTCSGLEG